ncbi:MAG: head GIN domain-containing protein [Chitinophagaceae bacterium]
MTKMFLNLAFSVLLTQATCAQNDRETIEGNGNKIIREVPVQSFSGLTASGVYELRLSQGDKESVKIEADENLQYAFEVKTENNRLLIDTKKLKNWDLRNNHKMIVYVTFKKLNEIELSTVGNVRSVEGLVFDELKLENKSVGNVDLTLTAEKLHVRNSSVGNIDLKGKAESAVFLNSGVGNFDAGDFEVQHMNIENTGVGNAEVNVARECKVKDSFLGKVKNRGAAPLRKSGKVVI